MRNVDDDGALQSAPDGLLISAMMNEGWWARWNNVNILVALLRSSNALWEQNSFEYIKHERIVSCCKSPLSLERPKIDEKNEIACNNRIQKKLYNQWTAKWLVQ